MDPGFVIVVGFVLVPIVMSLLAAKEAQRRANIGKHDTVLAAAAEALDLEARERGFGGRLDSLVEIELSGSSEGRLTGERIVVRARLLQPIATELDVTSRQAEAPSDPPIGGDFGRRFAVKTSRFDRAERMLRTRLGYELVLVDTAGHRVELDQSGVTLTGRWITQVDEVTRLVGSATRLAHLLVAAERAQPALLPWTDVARAWSRAAERLGARFDREARVLVLQGPFGSLTARPSTAREESWFGALSLRLERPLPVVFSLSDERGRSLWQRFTDREVLLGDRELDRAFVVETEEPEALLALLGPDLKRALIELERRTGTLSVDARGFEARFEGASVTNEAALGEVLAAAVGAAEVLGHAGVSAGQGAYR